MGYVVLHIEKAAGTDAAMSGHVERRITPANVITTLTYLNQELIEFPKGVASRTEAIQHRLDNAGLERKIGKNQVRALRVVMSGSPEDMKRIRQAGQLDAWAKDSCGWLQKTFGKENVVSAVLHLDEKTPHIHATVVPIVTGERRKVRDKKPDEPGKRKYRKKSTARPRLCADDVMTRIKLKEYQDTYAVAMAKYGLQRGIDGSEARHVTTQEFYRNAIAQQQGLQDNIGELLHIEEEKRQAIECVTEQEHATRSELNKTEAELKAVKGELKTERLKNSAAEVGTTIIDGIGAMIGTSKVKRQEQQIDRLRHEVAARDESIETLQKKITTMQSDHNRKITAMQARHLTETENTKKQHEKEVSVLQAIVRKALAWFPHFREMLRMDDLCRKVGFSDEQSETLISGKPLRYTGMLYSEQHRQRFKAENVIARITADETNSRKFILKIDGLPIVRWFREQAERLQHYIQPERNGRGLKM